MRRRSGYTAGLHPHSQQRTPCLSPSRTIYEKLSGAVTEEQRALFSQRVDEITPNIRYCAYNIGDMPSDISELMKLRSDMPGFDMLSSKIDVRIAVNGWMHIKLFAKVYS